MSRSDAVTLVAVCVLTCAGGLLFLESTPPGTAPDEASHFRRIGGLAELSLFGEPVPTIEDLGVGLNADTAQTQRVRREAGSYGLAEDWRYLGVNGGQCNAFQPDVVACAGPSGETPPPDQVSLHARAQPFPYIGSAALSSLGWSGRSTFFLARLAILLQVVALTAMAFATVVSAGDRERLPIVVGGWVLTMSPLAVSLSGVISPSAVECVGAASLTLLTWSIVRADPLPRCWCWFWISALAATALSRSVGLAYAALAVVAGAWSAGLRVRSVPALLGRRPTVMASAIVTAALLWDPLFKTNLAPTVSIGDGRGFVDDATAVWLATTGVADHLGLLDVTLPRLVSTGWLLYALWWILASFVVGDPMWLRRLAGIIALAGAIGVVMARGLQPTGFGMQPRFVLPGVGIVVLASALNIATRSATGRAAVRARPTVLVACVLTTVSCYAMLRRHVVGADGPIWFFGHPGFRPLGGWWLLMSSWLVLAVSGIAVTALVAARAGGGVREPVVRT